MEVDEGQASEMKTHSKHMIRIEESKEMVTSRNKTMTAQYLDENT